MENKSGIIIMTLIEKLKKNTQFFGNVSSAETFRKKYAYADIAMQNGDSTETYRVVVIKQAT